MELPRRPDWKRKRPAGWSHSKAAARPAASAGSPPRLNDTVTWTRIVSPREHYRVTYIDRDGAASDRVIELAKLGHSGDAQYLGVNHQGKFKTLRADRIVRVEQLSRGHPPSIRPFPMYRDMLPAFPIAAAVYRIATTAASNRTWTVDLNAYSCTCPEKRIRSGFGYAPGQLGFVCDHMAKAILAHLPADDAAWSPELRAFLADPRKVHIDNLTPAGRT